MKRLTCACCGSGAYGKQWWNQDTGFGLCAACHSWILGRGITSPEEISRAYGKPGEHYAVLLNQESIPGMLVGWKDENNELHVGKLKSYTTCGLAVINEIEPNTGQCTVPGPYTNKEAVQ